MTGDGEKVTHTYANLGDFIVILTVTDNDSYTGTATQLIKVLEKPLAPLNVAVERLVNKALFFKDYINKITWEENPQNIGLVNVIKYKIYRKAKGESDVQFTLITEVDSSTFEYWDRKFSNKQEADSYVYAVTAIDDQGIESDFSKSVS